MRILLAEDQQMARIVLVTHLRQWGHQVIETSSAEEALDYATHSHCNIDILIANLSMPKMDGIELSQKIRDMCPENHYVYIILLSSPGVLKDVLQNTSDGKIDDYLVRPFEEAELYQRILVAKRLIYAKQRLSLYNQSLDAVIDQQTEVVRETQLEIINRLFSAMESSERRPYYNHPRLIGSMPAHLAELRGWSPSKIHDIRIAAPLHDIGKIGIPDDLLSKKGTLSWEEFSVVQQHTMIGADILSHSQNQIIQMAEEIARYHHENWDGSGYPLGLQGEQIPEVARIVSIVDVYEALVEDRTYRKAIPQKEAIKIIQEEQGKKFDPDICQLFLDNIDDMQNRYMQSKSRNVSLEQTDAFNLFGDFSEKMPLG